MGRGADAPVGRKPDPVQGGNHPVDQSDEGGPASIAKMTIAADLFAR